MRWWRCIHCLHLPSGIIRGLTGLLLCVVRHLGDPWERKATEQRQETGVGPDVSGGRGTTPMSVVGSSPARREKTKRRAVGWAPGPPHPRA